MTTTQAMTQDALLKQFMDDRVDQMHRDLGVVPDAPAGTIVGPSLSTADDIRAIGAAGMAEIAARGPAVDVSGTARDVRSEERRVGTEFVSTCISRCVPSPITKKKFILTK